MDNSSANKTDFSPKPSGLKIENLVKDFSTTNGPLRVLDEISLELPANRNLAIIGPSGSGKSTLLHILGALEHPTSGNVTVLGEDLLTLDEHAQALYRRKKVGFVFQDHHLLPQCSVWENILMPALAEGPISESIYQRAQQLIEQVGLKDRIEHKPAKLSGGECQRVAIARAMLNSPPLLLADEPTGNLDSNTASIITELLCELQSQEQSMLIVVTHNHQLAEQMDQLLELRSGSFIASK